MCHITGSLYGVLYSMLGPRFLELMYYNNFMEKALAPKITYGNKMYPQIFLKRRPSNLVEGVEFVCTYWDDQLIIINGSFKNISIT